MKGRLTEKYPNLARVLGDYGNRAAIMLALSLAVNALFVVYNGVLAVVYKASWNIVLGGYYMMLLVSKIGLLFGFGKTKRKSGNAELHGALTYLTGGLVLFILHVPLVILVTLLKDNSFHYAGILVYVYAAYAFYKIIAAIVNFVKSYKRKYGLVLQAMRNINLADALVSVLALQTALISAFGDLPNANTVTGGIICGLVLIGSILMIIRASAELVRIRRNSSGRENEE